MKVKLSDNIIPKFQAGFCSKKYTHRIYTSGRAGTKSSEMALECIYKLITYNNIAIIVMCKHHNKLRKTVFNECKRAISRLGLAQSKFKITVSPMMIKHKKTGNDNYSYDFLK